MPRKKRTVLNSNKNHNEIHIHIGKRKKNGVKRNVKRTFQQNPIILPQYIPQYFQSLPPIPQQFQTIINPPEDVLNNIKKEEPRPISLGDKRLYEEREDARFSTPIETKDNEDYLFTPIKEEKIDKMTSFTPKGSNDIKRLLNNRDGRSTLTNDEFNLIDSVYPNEFSKNSRIGSVMNLHPELKPPKEKKITNPPFKL